MPTFMLHFACTPQRIHTNNQQWAAECCLAAANIAEAEEAARQLIQDHAYQANELIAFTTISEEMIHALSESEATLYLKAQASHEQRAVVFSQMR